jgi:hypothetical protein
MSLSRARGRCIRVLARTETLGRTTALLHI